LNRLKTFEKAGDRNAKAPAKMHAFGEVHTTPLAQQRTGGVVQQRNPAAKIRELTCG
jgi:hypothetical protein